MRDKPGNLSTDESRRNAREDCVKHYIEHERRQGRDVSEEKVRTYINQRADVQDKRKDWGVKD